jgi:hypothetical protein
MLAPAPKTTTWGFVEKTFSISSSRETTCDFIERHSIVFSAERATVGSTSHIDDSEREMQAPAFVATSIESVRRPSIASRVTIASVLATWNAYEDFGDASIVPIAGPARALRHERDRKVGRVADEPLGESAIVRAAAPTCAFPNAIRGGATRTRPSLSRASRGRAEGTRGYEERCEMTWRTRVDLTPRRWI